MNKTLNRKERKEKKGAFGSSKASLHAKSFVFDREKVFIGSLNLDPRSIVENTEIGIMVTSKEVADILADAFDQMVEKIAFRLELHTDEEGIEFIYWHGLEDGEERVWKADPHTSFWRRFGLGLVSLLPVESQL